MNIRLTSNFDLQAFKTLLPEIKLYSRADKEPIDLLVFPGGEDVSLEFYMEDEFERESFENLCSSNLSRDIYERNLFIDLVKMGKVNKTLGICRGCQFLNVMLGGTLYQDLDTYGKKHGSSHRVEFLKNSKLKFFEKDYVNSYHHQAVKYLGTNLEGKVLAVEPKTRVPEIVLWEDSILGIQSHPEYYSDDYLPKKQFRDFLYDWVKN
jgi:putative glutamine amidotransferase